MTGAIGIEEQMPDSTTIEIEVKVLRGRVTVAVLATHSDVEPYPHPP